MAGVGLYFERQQGDVIFPARERMRQPRALIRYVPGTEMAQRVTEHCRACHAEVPPEERRVQPHIFRFGCEYSTEPVGFCGPCYRSSETGQALREPAVHNYGDRCRLSSPVRREAWAVALGVLHVHATHEVHNWAQIEVPRGVEAPSGVQRSAAQLTQLRKDIVFTLFGLVIP
ncbi:hypothetical protein AAVH_20635 [Aphelenchoides avenae]|nr:hypothetical protein AAVH_20635 [Aphelenchus avenae]